VSPWRIGSGPAPTKLCQPSRSLSPSTAVHRIRPVQHPHRLAARRGRFEHVAERRHERVDPTSQILKIDQNDVACIQHRVGRFAHCAVQAEHRDAVDRIVEVGRLDHVVLLVAAQAMLRTERSDELDIAAGGERIERMCQVLRHRRRVCQ